MKALKVTCTYSITDGTRTFTQIWAAGRVGHGTAIHLVITGANAICGTGNNGRGTRGRSTPRIAKLPIESVTCKKCLTKLAEHKADASYAIVDADEVSE